MRPMKDQRAEVDDLPPGDLVAQAPVEIVGSGAGASHTVMTTFPRAYPCSR
jgi:hypothetical protein